MVCVYFILTPYYNKIANNRAQFTEKYIIFVIRHGGIIGMEINMYTENLYTMYTTFKKQLKKNCTHLYIKKHL